MKKERGWEIKEVVLQAKSKEELWENQFHRLTTGWEPY